MFYCVEVVSGLFFMFTHHLTCPASCHNQSRQVLLSSEEQRGTRTPPELKTLVKKNRGRPLHEAATEAFRGCGHTGALMDTNIAGVQTVAGGPGPGKMELIEKLVPSASSKRAVIKI